MVAWLVLALGLGVTVFGWHFVREDERADAAARFSFRTSQITQSISERMAIYEQFLRNGVGLFNASRAVTRSEWRAFVEEAQIRRFFPGIQGLGFARAIPPDEREAVVAEIRSEGFDSFDIEPQGEREFYSAVVYLEPLDWRNQRAVGYDMFSEPIRRAAMIRARDTGNAAASGKVILVQETGEDRQTGFLMYLPVYRSGASLTMVEQRRAALAGWVYSPFRMSDLMRGIVGTDRPDLRIEIFDAPSMSASDLMHDSQPALDDWDPDHLPLFQTVTRLTVAGHDWHVRLSSLPEFEAAIDVQKERLVLIGGLIGSLLMFGIVAAQARNRERMAQALAEKECLLADKDTLLREVHHRVKNNLQALWGLLQIERAQITDPLARHRLDEIGQRINVMGNVHRQLYTSGDLTHVDMGEHLDRLCQDLASLHGRPDQVTVRTAAEHLTCGLDTAIPLGLITNELVSNSLKHAFPDERRGTVEITLRRAGPGRVELRVADDGIGLPTCEGERPTGIGMTLIHALASQLEATVAFTTHEGAVATVSMPGRHFTAS